MMDLIERQAAIDAINEMIVAELEKRQKPSKAYWAFVAAKMKMRCVPSAQPETHEERTETLACDLISRQAAIDALEEQLDYLQMLNKDENPKAESKWYGVNWARNTIADLPSAQPDMRGNTSGTQITLDCISRQAAIDALKEHRALFCDNTPDTFAKLSYGEKYRVDELDGAIATLINLPSAQPEPTGTFGALIDELGKGRFDAVTFDANGCVFFKKKPDKCDRCRFTFFEKGEGDDGQ